MVCLRVAILIIACALRTSTSMHAANGLRTLEPSRQRRLGLLLHAVARQRHEGRRLMRMRGGGRPEREKVCIIGSGNWGCAIARLVALNTLTLGNFEPQVRMWVYEELVDGRNLTEIINTRHENPKYLANITLPSNILAVPDLASAVQDSSVLVWVVPHQFLGRLLPTVKAAMRNDAISVSLIKGMAADEDRGLMLISSYIAKSLGVSEVSVLMGANVADQVARDHWCEATLGSSDSTTAQVLLPLFDRPTFRIRVVSDVAGVEVFGALKNVVALGAGFADGLGQGSRRMLKGFADGLGLGSNSKAAVMRIGLIEMLRFAKTFFPTVEEKTMWESCGIADLITTCFDGRNRRCAQRFVAASEEGWQVLEQQLLGGQKLQGPLTAAHVHHMLEKQGLTKDFPLLETLYGISIGQIPPSSLVDRAPTYY